MVSERNAKVPLHRRIGEIALESGDREFFCEMMEKCRGEAKIALRIFEVNRVHFVWHGGRSYFAPDFLLRKNPARDVKPKIAGEINKNRVDAEEMMTEFREIIMGIDLRRVAKRCKTE